MSNEGMSFTVQWEGCAIIACQSITQPFNAATNASPIACATDGTTAFPIWSATGP